MTLRARKDTRDCVSLGGRQINVNRRIRVHLGGKTKVGACETGTLLGDQYSPKIIFRPCLHRTEARVR